MHVIYCLAVHSIRMSPSSTCSLSGRSVFTSASFKAPRGGWSSSGNDLVLLVFCLWDGSHMTQEITECARARTRRVSEPLLVWMRAMRTAWPRKHSTQLNIREGSVWQVGTAKYKPALLWLQEDEKTRRLSGRRFRRWRVLSAGSWLYKLVSQMIIGDLIENITEGSRVKSESIRRLSLCLLLLCYQ